MISKIRNSMIVRNSGWMLLARTMRTAMQAAYFVLLTRSLGAAQYGAFSATVALVGVLAPFASLGTGNLLVKNVARNRNLMREYIGNALLVTGISGALLLAGAAVAERWWFARALPMLLLVTIGIADLLFARLAEIIGQIYQAVDRLSKTSQVQILLTATRMISAAILLVGFRHAQAVDWAVFYLASSAVVVLIGAVWVLRDFGTPRLALWRIRGEFIEGVHFSISNTSQTTYNDIDKTLLARMVSLDVAGFYAAAYRIGDVILAPISSVLYATYAPFFRNGASGIEGSYRYARRFISYATAYGLLAFVLMIAAAPQIAHILGPGYAPVASVLRWIAILPLIRSLHYFAADTLTGAGYQHLRSITQLCVAGTNVLLNLWLIPHYSWRGAAWASLASDGLLAVSLWTILSTLRHRANSRLRAEGLSVAS